MAQQEEVLSEAEGKQALLAEPSAAAQVQTAEGVSSDAVRRLLNAELRRRPSSAGDEAARRMSHQTQQP